MRKHTPVLRVSAEKLRFVLECQKMQPKFRRQKNSQHLHLKILAAAFETNLTDYSPLCSSSYTVCTYSSIHQFSINQVSSLWCLSQWTLNTTGTHPTIRLQKGMHSIQLHTVQSPVCFWMVKTRNTQMLITSAANIELTNNNMCNIHFIVCMNNMYAVYETN